MLDPVILKPVQVSQMAAVETLKAAAVAETLKAAAVAETLKTAAVAETLKTAAVAETQMAVVVLETPTAAASPKHRKHRKQYHHLSLHYFASLLVL
jgi:hypothetical protein